MRKLEANGINLNVGDSVKVVLEQSFGTGYTWQIDEASAQGLLSLSKEDVRNLDQGMYLLGGASTLEVTLKALKPGNAKFHAAKVRGWEFSGFT